MERVSVFEGKTPILIIAPHGSDDIHTGTIAESAIKRLNCFGVINRGWRKSKSVNCFEDDADCNNIVHLHKDVVKEEVLNPILNYRSRILKKHPWFYIFIIHGIGNHVRKIAKDPTLDMIVGYGAGHHAFYTCDLWRKNLFINLNKSTGIYEASAGSPYAGWNEKNLNQLFRRHHWYPCDRTHSMQLEIVMDLRDDKEMAMLTGDFLASNMAALLKHENWTTPKDFEVKQI
jgi:hypothetical protein